jgi:hypothetical protein
VKVARHKSSRGFAFFAWLTAAPVLWFCGWVGVQAIF